MGHVKLAIGHAEDARDMLQSMQVWATGAAVLLAGSSTVAR